jgi:hypothetical protein
MKMRNNISNPTNETESLSPLLRKLKLEDQGFKVPYGYFDSLNPRIADAIQKQENRSVFKTFFFSFRRPLVWAPSMALIITILLIIVIPTRKEPVSEVTDEWNEISMAYDPSYAEEVFFTESNLIDTELENADNNIMTVSITGNNEPTDEEITKYLKDQDVDPELLIEN